MGHNLRKAVVVATHPDDEIGIAGTLVKIGHDLSTKIIYVTLNEATGGSKEEAIQASKILGAEYVFLGEKDMKVKFNEKTLMKLIRELHKCRPDIIFIPWIRDVHADHQQVAKICRQALYHLKSLTTLYGEKYRTFIPKLVLEYEGIKPFSDPEFFVDISDVYKIKERLLKVYHDQSRCYPSYRNIVLSLARFRGSQVNVECAEAFKLYLGDLLALLKNIP
jgi:LmbE family N-acetylglucosaminyl deacetylase